MNHVSTDIVIIASIIIFTGTIGVCLIYNRIIPSHAPNYDLVIQHNNIELNIIEPTHPSRIYNQIDSYQIYSWLENEINLDLIFWLILFLMIVLLIYFVKNLYPIFPK
jgi:hypothetical protein